MRALVLVLALAACRSSRTPAEPAAETPAPAAETAASNDPAVEPGADAVLGGARAAGVDFRAVGQEPGWIIDIYTRGPHRRCCWIMARS